MVVTVGPPHVQGVYRQRLNLFFKEDIKAAGPVARRAVLAKQAEADQAVRCFEQVV